MVGALIVGIAGWLIHQDVKKKKQEKENQKHAVVGDDDNSEMGQEQEHEHEHDDPIAEEGSDHASPDPLCDDNGVGIHRTGNDFPREDGEKYYPIIPSQSPPPPSQGKEREKGKRTGTIQRHLSEHTRARAKAKATTNRIKGAQAGTFTGFLNSPQPMSIDASLGGNNDMEKRWSNEAGSGDDDDDSDDADNDDFDYHSEDDSWDSSKCHDMRMCAMEDGHGTTTTTNMGNQGVEWINPYLPSLP